MNNKLNSLRPTINFSSADVEAQKVVVPDGNEGAAAGAGQMTEAGMG